MTYLPSPPRVWSRVQSSCIVNDDSTQMLAKGNILQYKNNSANLTKQQRYSQLARCIGPNRRKSYATQTEIYTNPNTSSFKRVNSVEIPFPNAIVGQPNNVSGPFQYDVTNPYGCPLNSVESGGSLICNTVVNPCTKESIYKTKKQLCFSITDSDVPGFNNHRHNVTKILCWNNAQTWYPRQRYTMNNSGNKWPQNYKGFVSACVGKNNE